MGATLAFAMSAYAQNYKINKVGNDEEKSFNVMLNQAVVGEAPAGSWLEGFQRRAYHLRRAFP